MQLPTEIKITSHRPFIGRFIVLYKKIIHFFIAPYIRNVIDALDERLEDILKRSDALIVILDQRLETLSVSQEQLKEELKKHREEILSSIAKLEKRIEMLELKKEIKSKG